ncbi:MAG: hypothetical protein A2000_07630 [Ignavibacteria bacterium GWB2_36_8]|nr:MAG: hypothetical protein A2000_07630 [Ignavibacteria bacterium GWB2_36_8]OGU49200.1 MAG: hypothetical protein A2080_12470 [Ignavibacteria bacterium GWC2_36_12]
MKHQGFIQSLVWLLITVHVVTIYGCSVTNRVTLPGNEIPVGSNFKIATVVLKNGEIIEFDSKGGRYIEKTTDGKSNRVIVGMTGGKNVEIDPEKVLEVRFEQEGSSSGGSFIAGFLIGIPVGAGVFYLILVAAYSGH